MLLSDSMSQNARITFDRRDRKALIDVIKKTDGGRYVETLLQRDMSTNSEKHKIWNKITSKFSEAIDRSVTVKQTQRLWYRYRFLANRRKGRDEDLAEFEKSSKKTGGGPGMSPPSGSVPI